MRRTLRSLPALVSFAAASATAAAQQAPRPALNYPTTRRAEQVDDYHGTRVADPYRWLEDVDGEETTGWVAAQNAVTERYLAALPTRAALKERLTTLWNYAKYSAPRRYGKKYFYYENPGLANQSVLYVQDRPGAPGRVVIDPNALSADGTVALTALDVTADARLAVYGTSQSGSDWQEFRVRDVERGRDLPDTLRWIKFSGASWTDDGKGFFYSRYAEPASGEALTGVNRHQKLYYHRLGTPQGADELIYERPDEPEWGFDARVTDDGRYAVVSVSQGTDERNRLYVIDLVSPRKPRVTAPVVKVFDRFDASYDYVGNVGETFYFRTNNGAPRGRVIALDLNDLRERDWRTIVPEGPDALEGAQVVGREIVASYLSDAKSALRRYGFDGKPRGEVALPGVGTVTEVSGRPGDAELFYTFTSYLAPATVYRYDLARGTSTVYKRPELAFDASRYETRQLFATSKDGTRVPLFVTARKDVRLDGTNATLLYSYGGFNVPMTPGFSPATLVWLEMGGVYAVANLRGGGEYGRAWHEAGMFEKKQNVFDDFIAAAEHLVREKYTAPARLAIQGGSNGGLLVGAAMTQRPELFGVALPAVGVMDMLRFHKFTIGWAWTAEYGSADEPDQFPYLRAYSPLHNLKPGTRYPATLVTTADHDDRVVPGHSFKYAAALQGAQAKDGPPVLIRVDVKAGHGAGKPTAKRIDEIADVFAFTLQNLGVTTAAAVP
jgi:prolyl oligopeptidase